MILRILLISICLISVSFTNAQEIWSKSTDNSNGNDLFIVKPDGKGGFWVHGGRSSSDNEQDTIRFSGDTIVYDSGQCFLVHINAEGTLTEKHLFSGTRLFGSRIFQSFGSFNGDITIGNNHKTFSMKSGKTKIYSQNDSISLNTGTAIFQLNDIYEFEWLLEGKNIGSIRHISDVNNQYHYFAYDFDLTSSPASSQVSFDGNTFNERSGILYGKISSSGQLLWVKVADAGFINDFNSQVEFDALVADDDENLYISGTVKDSITFDNQTLVRDATGADPFIAKVDPQGNLEWLKAFKSNSPGGSAIQTLKFYKNKGYLGGFIYDGIIEDDTLSGTGAFVAQFETDGTVNWSTGLSPQGVVSHLAFNEDGLYAGMQGFSVKHLDFDGNELWTYQNSSNSSASLHSIGLDSLDNISVFGRFNGPMNFGDSFYFSTKREYYMANIINCNDFNLSMEPASNQIVIYDTQGVDITASLPEKYTVDDYKWYRDGKLSNKDSVTFSLKPPYPDFVNSATVKLIAEGKYGCIDSSDIINITIKDTGTSIPPIDKNGTIEAWPNPVSSNLNIKLSHLNNGSSIEVGIINSSGKQVYSGDFPANSKQINITTHNLMRGVYVLKVVSEGEVVGRKKFIRH